MKPAPFDYVRPLTVDAALQALADHKDGEAKVLAGGQSLIPMMNYRVAQPSLLIDINQLQELNYIEVRGDVIAIGAITRHAAVKSNELIRENAPLIAEAYEHVAHATIRNRGTLGGNLVHADPASEMPAVMCALGAQVVLRSKTGKREVNANDFFLGPLMTAIEPDELLVEIQIPIQTPGEGYAFEEVSLRKGDFAIAAVAAIVAMKNGTCTKAVLCAAGISDRAVRIDSVEQQLIGSALSQTDFERAADAFVAAIDFSATASITAEYRLDLTHALILRSLSHAVALVTRRSQ